MLKKILTYFMCYIFLILHPCAAGPDSAGDDPEGAAPSRITRSAPTVRFPDSRDENIGRSLPWYYRPISEVLTPQQFVFGSVLIFLVLR